MVGKGKVVLVWGVDVRAGRLIRRYKREIFLCI